MNWQASSTRTLALNLAVAGIVALGLAPAAARADDPGVARISNLQSNVAVKRGDSGDTVAAALNAPLMSGDYLTTGDDSRAEVQFDNADFLRAGSDAQLRFTQLGAAGDTTQLAAGTVELRVYQQATALEIDTPSITIRPTNAGAYRVTVDDSGTTFVTVRNGSASIVTPQGTSALAAGSTLQASGSAANPQIQSVSVVADDDFDTWNDQRDQATIAATSTQSDSQYVNPGVVGASDLNADGTWQDDPSYGDVWVPSNVAPGWAPYTDGQWAWEGYYGWTWVSYEPWGWAPYHYGRWFYAANRWAWYPGPVYARPVWQPALVGFFGFHGGGGLSIGVGFGNIGWVPLAPYETYHPWYGPRGYTNVTNINVSINNYRNYNAPGAISGIPSNAWNGGTFGRRYTLSPGQVHNVTAISGALPLTPTHANLAFSQQPVNATNLPRPRTLAFNSFASRPVSRPVPFEQSREQVQSVTQQRFNPTQSSQTTQFRSNQGTPTSYRTQTLQNAQVTHSTDAWSRFNNAHGSNTNSPYTSHTVRPASTTNSSRSNSNSNNSTHNSNGNRNDDTSRPPTAWNDDESMGTRSYQPSSQASGSYEPARSYQQPRSSYRSSYQAPQRTYTQSSYRSAPITQRTATARSASSTHTDNSDHTHSH